MLSCLFKTEHQMEMLQLTESYHKSIFQKTFTKSEFSALPLCLLMKSIILCSPSPGTLASDKKTCRTKYLFIDYIPQQHKNSIKGLITFHLRTYCDIAPSRVIGESVCDVISQTFGQIIHELGSLNATQENY